MSMLSGQTRQSELFLPLAKRLEVRYERILGTRTNMARRRDN
jgi:hypothetical protein